MSTPTRILFLGLFCLAAVQGVAQTKIGYTNLELVLAYMPESKVANQELQVFEKKLAEKLEIKRSYLASKYEEYQLKAQKNQFTSEAAKTAEEQDLNKLQEELRTAANDAEQQVQGKRGELYQPILEKLQKAIEEVAKANGYTYILNIGGGSGVSNILYGPEEDNITERLFKHLGLELPKEETDTTTTGGGK